MINFLFIYLFALKRSFIQFPVTHHLKSGIFHIDNCTRHIFYKAKIRRISEFSILRKMLDSINLLLCLYSIRNKSASHCYRRLLILDMKQMRSIVDLVCPSFYMTLTLMLMIPSPCCVFRLTSNLIILRKQIYIIFIFLKRH